MTIVQYWHSKEAPDYIAALFATLRRSNPGARHLVFNEGTAAELIAERFEERHLAAFRACAVPAMQADYFRYCAVYALGGIYVDADFGCARSLDPLLEPAGQLFKHPRGPVINGLFAFRSPGHPFLAMAIEIATLNIERRLGSHVGVVTGPLIFTALDRLRRAGSMERLREEAPLGRAPKPIVAIVEKAAEAVGPTDLAFEGLRISPRDAMRDWIVVPDRAELPYKEEEAYWFNWRGSIFHPALRER